MLTDSVPGESEKAQSPVVVLYTFSNHRFEPSVFEQHMRSLPAAMQQTIRRFMRWEDAQLGLLGKILLRETLKLSGIASVELDKIAYTEFNRPYYAEEFDFNISHSGNMVVCAVSKQSRIGIDIEIIRPINMEEFTDQFTASELNQMRNSAEPLREFYRWWTRKEAILKADGKGLNIPLKSIRFKDETLAEVENRQWHLHELVLHENYCGHIAAERDIAKSLRIQHYILHGQERTM